jgi:hypothetical protein
MDEIHMPAVGKVCAASMTIQPASFFITSIYPKPISESCCWPWRQTASH